MAANSHALNIRVQQNSVGMVCDQKFDLSCLCLRNSGFVGEGIVLFAAVLKVSALLVQACFLGEVLMQVSFRKLKITVLFTLLLIV